MGPHRPRQPQRRSQKLSVDDLYYFHVRGIDTAGNPTDTNTLGPFVISSQGVSNLIDLDPSAASDRQGLEQFYPYDTHELGTATEHTNLQSGNAVVQSRQWQIPGIGVNTVLRATYNSQRNDPSLFDQPLGAGWSLSVSDVAAGLTGTIDAASSIDVDAPITAMPGKTVLQNVKTTAGVASGRIVEFTDGDGTTHRFVRQAATPPGPHEYWESPPGVNLRLVERDDSTGLPIEYDFVRPDGVTYVAENLRISLGLPTDMWRITQIKDRDGNTLKLDYQLAPNPPTNMSSHADLTDAACLPSGTAPGPNNAQIPLLQLKKITHTYSPASGAAQPDGQTNPLVVFNYDSTTNYLTDLDLLATQNHAAPEREVTFNVSKGTGEPQAELKSITESANTADARTTTFGYGRASGGSSDPWVMRSVTDARGHTSSLDYSTPASDNKPLLKTLTDRLNDTWAYDYSGSDTPPSGCPTTGPAAATETIVTAPSNGSGTGAAIATKYFVTSLHKVGDDDSSGAPARTGGNICAITDAGNDSGAVTNTYQWSKNHLVTKKDGGGNATSYTYDALGDVTSTTSPAPNPAASGGYSASVSTTMSYSYSGNLTGCTPPSPDDGSCSTTADLSEVDAGSNVTGQKRVTKLSYAANVPGKVSCVLQLGQASSPGTCQSPDQSPSDRNSWDRATKLSYYNDGDLASMTDPRGNTTSYGDGTQPHGGYDPSGQPGKITDAMGFTTTLGYDVYGELTQRQIDEGGGASRYECHSYDNLGRLTSTTLNGTSACSQSTQGRKTTFTYDGNDNLVTTTPPRGNASTSAAAFQTIDTYDNDDDLVEERGPDSSQGAGDGSDTTYAYYPDGSAKSTTTKVDATTSATTTRNYFPNGALKSVSVPTAPDASGTLQYATTDYSYDGNNRIKTVKGPLPDATHRMVSTYTYAPNGNVATEQDTTASGGTATTTYTYDAFDDTTQVVGPRTVTCPSDGTQSLQQKQTATYDAFGEITGKSELKGFVGDGAASCNSVSLTWSYTHDLAGSIVSSTQPAGSDTSPSSLVTQYSYDADNRLTLQSDPFNPNHYTGFAYTGEGHKKAVYECSDPASFAGASCGPNSNTTWRRVTITTFNPDFDEVQSEVSTDYSEATRPTEGRCNYASGQSATSGYDADGNLTDSRTMKIATNLTGADPCTTGTQIAARHIDYDNAGRIKTATQKVAGPAGDVTRTETPSYNMDGSLRSLTWTSPQSPSVTNHYSFDYGHSAGGLVTSAQVGSSDDPGLTTHRAAFSYGPSGQLSGEVLGGTNNEPMGAAATLSYNADTSLGAIKWSTGCTPSSTGTPPATPCPTDVYLDTNIAYNDAGMMTSEQIAARRPSGGGDNAISGAEIGNPGTARFDYDLAGWLTSWTSPFNGGPSLGQPTTTYTLDGAGNVTSAVVTATPTGGSAACKFAEATSDYGATERLGQRTDKTWGIAQGTTDCSQTQNLKNDTYGFSYSGVGEETERTIGPSGSQIPDHDYRTSYDPMGMTAARSDTAATNPDPTITYTYDATSNLVSRSRSGSTTLYFYSAVTGALVEESDGSGATKTLYLRDDSGAPLGQYSPKATTKWIWLLTNARGDVVSHVSASGSVTKLLAYDPYGEPDSHGTTTDQTQTPDPGSDLGFDSALTDPTTNDLILGPRQYDPTIQHFTTADFLTTANAGLALATDTLTGNRYAFAAANPVGLYDDGYCADPYACPPPRGASPQTRRSWNADQERYAQERQQGGSFTAAQSRSSSSGSSSQPTYGPGSPNWHPNLINVNPFLAGAAAAPHGCDCVTLSDVGHVLRFALNAPISGPAVLWADANRGSCDLEQGAVLVCYQVRTWSNGPMPVLTVGNVVLSEHDRKEFSSHRGGLDLLQHESAHTTQWLIPGFPALYALSAGVSEVTTGSPTCANVFEVQAGLRRGGYTSC